jgi:hypothetical protein
MNLDINLETAKAIIGEQQIALSLLNRKLSTAYIPNELGQLLHGACGEVGLTRSGDEFLRCCSCFPSSDQADSNQEETPEKDTSDLS